MGQRLDQAVGGRSEMVFADSDRFLFPLAYCLRGGADSACGYVKAVYQAGLKSQGISVHRETKPELRVDRGSPNTSGITQEFFESLGAELSFARVRRPTDNALTERFYGTVKQEEIYLVGNYPDEISAREERPLHRILQSLPTAPGAV
jgi:hypothetical protein